MKTREIPIQVAVQVSLNAIGFIKELMNQPEAGLSEIQMETKRRSFVRNFATLGEYLTFFRKFPTKSHGKFNELLNDVTDIKDPNGDPDSIVYDFINSRNKLIHEYPVARIKGNDADFLIKAKTLVNQFIVPLENSLITISNKELVKSGAKCIKKIGDVPEDNSTNTLLDYAKYAEKESEAFNIFLSSATSLEQIDTLCKDNRHLKSTLLNFIENSLEFINKYNQRRSQHFDKFKNDKEINNIELSFSMNSLAAYELLTMPNEIRNKISHNLETLSTVSIKECIDRLQEINKNYLNPIIPHLERILKEQKSVKLRNPLIDNDNNRIVSSSSSSSLSGYVPPHAVPQLAPGASLGSSSSSSSQRNTITEAAPYLSTDPLLRHLTSSAENKGNIVRPDLTQQTKSTGPTIKSIVDPSYGSDDDDGNIIQPISNTQSKPTASSDNKEAEPEVQVDTAKRTGGQISPTSSQTIKRPANEAMVAAVKNPVVQGSTPTVTTTMKPGSSSSK